MSRRRLIESLLASGRRIHQVPDDVRQRAFARALAAAQVAAGERAQRDRRPRCRRRVLGPAGDRRWIDPRRLWSSIATRPVMAWWGAVAGALRPPRHK